MKNNGQTFVLLLIVAVIVIASIAVMNHKMIKEIEGEQLVIQKQLRPEITVKKEKDKDPSSAIDFMAGNQASDVDKNKQAVSKIENQKIKEEKQQASIIYEIPTDGVILVQ